MKLYFFSKSRVEKKRIFFYVFLGRIVISYIIFSKHRARRARKLKKVQAKKPAKSKFFFLEIAFLAVLNFFPVQKLIFGHEIWSKIFFVKLIYLISRIFWPGLFLIF